jgi:hypothetical protein
MASLALLLFPCGFGMVFMSIVYRVYCMGAPLTLARRLGLIDRVGWNEAPLTLERKLRAFARSGVSDRELDRVLTTFTIINRTGFVFAVGFGLFLLVFSLSVAAQ